MRGPPPSPQPVLWACWNPILMRAETWTERRLRWTLFLPFALALPTAYYLIVHGVGSWGRVA
jgi:hypothetical protein